MLDLTEKIVAGACGVLVLVTLAAYLWLGTPSTTSAEFLPSVEKSAVEAPPPPKAGEPSSLPQDEQLILEKLAQQGLKPLAGQRLQRESLRVPVKTFEYISAEANWLPELHKLGSSAAGNRETRRKIFDIQEDSLLKKLGFQENDVIELIDGQIIEFSEKSTTKHLDLFKSSMAKLRQGQPISVTITRNNRPLHLEFKL